MNYSEGGDEMSTHDDRLQVIQTNYLDALQNETFDLAKTPDPVQISSIQANLANARVIYFTAVVSSLRQNNNGVEIAYQSAVDARQEVTKARTRSASIPELIGKLQSSTDKAADLLQKAKT